MAESTSSIWPGMATGLSRVWRKLCAAAARLRKLCASDDDIGTRAARPGDSRLQELASSGPSAMNSGRPASWPASCSEEEG
jgi:hypothetical protein